jgi:hypothetical protein
MALALLVGVGKASGPGIEIAGFYGGPLPPIAGQNFEVALEVVKADTGKAIPSTLPTCSARLRGQALGSTPYILRNQSRCRWQLPANGGGATLRGSIRVTYSGSSVSRSFALKVARTPEVLKVFPNPNYAPAAPSPGVVFYAAVKVRFVGPRGTERNLRPRSSTAACRATVSGAPMKVTKTQVQPGGVICGWLVPAGASGKPVVLVVTVHSEGQTASRTFHLRAR